MDHTPDELVNKYKRRGLFDEQRSRAMDSYLQSPSCAKLSHGVTQFVRDQLVTHPELLSDRTKAIGVLDQALRRALQSGQVNGGPETDSFISDTLSDGKSALVESLCNLEAQEDLPN